VCRSRWTRSSLETYLETHGNVSETARRHNLHPQSLLYRLQRIEELTGGALSDPEHRFALELRAHLYRLRDVVPPDAEWSHPRPARIKPARVRTKNKEG
jgi:DNA-binding PucR family transcriptional regulator